MEKSKEWLEDSKAGLTRAFAVAFQDWEAELARRDEEKQSLMDHMSELVIKNAQLVQENNKLKDQLSSAQMQNFSRTENSDLSKETQEELGIEPGKPVSYEDYASLASRLEELRTRNLKTETTLEEAIEENERLRRKNEHAVNKFHTTREACREWQAHNEKITSKYKELKKQVSRSNSTATKPTRSLNTADVQTTILKPLSGLTPPTTPSAFANSPTPMPLNARDRLCPINELQEATSNPGNDQQRNKSGFLLSQGSSVKPLELSNNPSSLPETIQAVSVNAHEDGVTETSIDEMRRYIGTHWGVLKTRDRKSAREIVWRGDPEKKRHQELKDLPAGNVEELYTHIRDVVCRSTAKSTLNLSNRAPVPHADENIGIMDFAFDTSSVAGPPVSEQFLSSQATEDDAAAEENVLGIQPREQVDDDVDLPVVVSAKILKRKRPGRDLLESSGRHRPEGESVTPISIKDEPNSPPILPLSPRRLERNETLDLDELGVRIVTPRKLQRQVVRPITREIIRSVALQNLRYERSTSEPAVKSEPEVDLEAYVRPFEATRLTALEDAEENSKYRASSGPAPVQRTGLVTSPKGVLQSLDPNTKVISRRGEEEPEHKRRRRAEELGAENTPINKPESHDDLSKGHLNQLMRSARRDAIAKAKTPSKQPGRRSLLQNPTTPSSTAKSRSARDRIVAQATPTSRPGSSHSSQIFTSHASSRATHTPLRARPIERLTLDHFKPNPAYNQGLDYAFVETVRSRDARKCLPGCTKPECCGSAFRALAMAAPTLAAPRRLFDSDDEIDDEERLLQNFMGAAYDAARIRRMPAEERAELVLQARTRLLADMHGRHKQAYERRVTPPGFWRTDFPTTQEVEKDREEARKLDKAKVEERWRDAMREGGRWIFRDE